MIDHLLEIVGPVILLSITSAGLAMIRTRTNAHRITELEKTVDGLAILPQLFARLEERVRAERRQAEERAQENRDDHREIKDLLEQSERRMISEIRRNGNGAAVAPR
jgi:hypothetical protein